MICRYISAVGFEAMIGLVCKWCAVTTRIYTLSGNINRRRVIRVQPIHIYLIVIRRWSISFSRHESYTIIIRDNCLFWNISQCIQSITSSLWQVGGSTSDGDSFIGIPQCPITCNINTVRWAIAVWPNVFIAGNRVRFVVFLVFILTTIMGFENLTAISVFFIHESFCEDILQSAWVFFWFHNL